MSQSIANLLLVYYCWNIGHVLVMMCSVSIMQGFALDRLG